MLVRRLEGKKEDWKKGRKAKRKEERKGERPEEEKGGKKAHALSFGLIYSGKEKGALW